MRKLSKLIVLLFSLALFVSCTSTNSLGKKAIVKAIYVDTKSDGFDVSLVVFTCNPSSQIAEIKEEANVYTSFGNTLDTAIANAEGLQNNKPFYAQNELLFLSENAAKHNLYDIISFFTKEDASRPGLSVFLSVNSAEELKDSEKALPNIIKEAENISQGQAKLSVSQHIYDIKLKNNDFSGYIPIFEFGKSNADFCGVKSLALFDNGVQTELLQGDTLQTALLLNQSLKSLSFNGIGERGISFSADGVSIGYQIEKNNLNIFIKGNIRSVTTTQNINLDKKEADILADVINEYIEGLCKSLIDETYAKGNDIFNYDWWLKRYSEAPVSGKSTIKVSSTLKII